MNQITTVALRTAPNLNTMAAGMITNVLVCLHSFARNNLKGINPRKKTTTTTTKKKAKHSGLLWRGCFKCLLFVFKKSSGYIKVILRGVVSKLERRGYYYYFFLYNISLSEWGRWCSLPNVPIKAACNVPSYKLI